MLVFEMVFKVNILGEVVLHSHVKITACVLGHLGNDSMLFLLYLGPEGLIVLTKLKL